METDHVIWCRINHFYFLCWLVWFICFIIRKKNKRNWYKKSFWRISKKHCNNAFNRFYKISCNGSGSCIATGIHSSQQMVAEFSISNYNKLVAVCDSCINGYYDCVGNYKFPGNKSSHSKSCEEFKNGIGAAPSLPKVNVGCFFLEDQHFLPPLFHFNHIFS